MSVARLQSNSSQQALPHQHDAPNKLQLLLDGVLEEMMNSCILVASTVSVANAVLANQSGLSERMVSQYMPPQPTLFPQARLSLCTTVRTCALSILLSSYFDRLVFLRELTRSRLEEGHLVGKDASLPAVAKAWRMLAADAIEALAEFDRLDICYGREDQRDRLAIVIDLLSRSEAGGTPCIDAYGSVRLPFWAERRASRRVAKNLQAFFEVGDSLQRACVINASRNGVCVLGLQNLWEGARVYLLIGPGQRIGGSVMWSKDGKAGIELDCDLPDDSQLIAHLH